MTPFVYRRMISHTVKIKVQPNETVRFPGECVHCLQPAEGSMVVAKRNGRQLREVDVPLCTACLQRLQKQSGEEERLIKISRLATAVTFLSLVILVLLVTAVGMGMWLRLLLALPIAAGAAYLVHRAFQSAIRNAALDGTKAVRDAAQIEAFSWRATTFTFTNKMFAEHFTELNHALLMEI